MNQLFKYLYPEVYTRRIQKAFQSLGEDKVKLINGYLGTRIILEVLLVSIMTLTVSYGFLIAIPICIVFHYLYENLLLISAIRKRNHSIEKDAYEFMEIWSLTLKGNITLIKSLETTTKIVKNDFAKEVKKHLRQGSIEKIALSVHKSIPTKRLRSFLIESSRITTKEDLTQLIDKYLQEEYIQRNAKNERELGRILWQILVVSAIFLALMAAVIYLTPNWMK